MFRIHHNNIKRNISTQNSFIYWAIYTMGFSFSFNVTMLAHYIMAPRGFIFMDRHLNFYYVVVVFYDCDFYFQFCYSFEHFVFIHLSCYIESHVVSVYALFLYLLFFYISFDNLQDIYYLCFVSLYLIYHHFNCPEFLFSSFYAFK